MQLAYHFLKLSARVTIITIKKVAFCCFFFNLGCYQFSLELLIGSERALTATLGVIRDWTKPKPSAKLPRLTGSGLAGFNEL